MPHLRDQSLSALIGASEILQVLKPACFATIVYVDSDNYRNQAEIAAAIGSNQSTVSAYLTTLSDLPIPLVEKRGHPYVVTTAGETVIDLIDEMASSLGIDLYSVAWDDPDEKEEVKELFAPLYNSRSNLPFTILWVLGIQSGAVDSSQEIQSVTFETLIEDVDRLQRVTTSQVRGTLTDRFDPANVIDFDDDVITLTPKGTEQARLVDQLATYVEDWTDPTTSDDIDDSTHTAEARQIDTELAPDTCGEQRTPTQQAVPQSFQGKVQQPVTEIAPESGDGLPTLIPTFCLCPEDPSPEDPDTSVSPIPVLALTSMTAADLVEAATQIISSYESDIHLDLYWALQTEEGLLPVSPLVKNDTQQEQ